MLHSVFIDKNTVFILLRLNKRSFRPEHMVLAKEGEGGIPCVLEVNEMMGSELHLHVYTDDGTRLIIRVPTLGLDNSQRESLVNGAKLSVTFEGKVMHFFDPETHENLLNV